MDLTVGYRPAAVARAGVPAVVLPLAAAYAVYAAPGPWLTAAGFAVFAFVTAVFVPLSGRAAVRALRGAPLLTLDAEGVTLHSARVTLPWSNVAEARIEHRPGRPALLVFVAADERRAVAALRGLPRRFASSGIRRVGGPVFVRADQLARPVEDVLAAVPVRVRHRSALT